VFRVHSDTIKRLDDDANSW